jgi:hypothetical protein
VWISALSFIAVVLLAFAVSYGCAAGRAESRVRQDPPAQVDTYNQHPYGCPEGFALKDRPGGDGSIIIWCESVG